MVLHQALFVCVDAYFFKPARLPVEDFRNQQFGAEEFVFYSEEDGKGWRRQCFNFIEKTIIIFLTGMAKPNSTNLRLFSFITHDVGWFQTSELKIHNVS